MNANHSDYIRRAYAFVFDILFLFVCQIVITYLSVTPIAYIDIDEEWITMYVLIVSIVVNIGFFLALSLFWVKWNGQTLGKKLWKCQVIMDDGSTLTLKASLLRSFIGYTLLFLTLGASSLIAFFRDD
ncbi:MAG: RDD family protein, partial [Candidatus Scalindua sp.]|nr:RDD family protein [Candidatus Scalindua sp.]